MNEFIDPRLDEWRNCQKGIHLWINSEKKNITYCYFCLKEKEEKEENET